MLYDPKWEPEVKVDPLKLESLIAWLEKQPAHGEYSYWDCCGKCLLDIYLADVTCKPSTPAPETHHRTCGGHQNYTRIAMMRPWTFGAALDRARALSKG